MQLVALDNPLGALTFDFDLKRGHHRHRNKHYPTFGFDNSIHPMHMTDNHRKHRDRNKEHERVVRPPLLLGSFYLESHCKPTGTSKSKAKTSSNPYRL